jgi:hypothetical protein
MLAGAAHMAVSKLFITDIAALHIYLVAPQMQISLTARSFSTSSVQAAPIPVRKAREKTGRMDLQQEEVRS